MRKESPPIDPSWLPNAFVEQALLLGQCDQIFTQCAKKKKYSVQNSAIIGI